MPYIPDTPKRARYTKEYDVPVADAEVIEIIGNAMNEPNGFPPGEAAKTSIVFMGMIGEFILNEIQPYTVYQKGVEYNISEDLSIEIALTEGIHFIYMDNGVLQELVNPTDAQISDIYLNYVYVATVLYDASNLRGIAYDERHGTVMSGATHSNLHFTRGFQYVSGLGLNTLAVDQDGSSNAHAQFGIDAGACLDEDIYNDSSALTSTIGTRIFYRSNSNWRWTTKANGYSVLTTGTGRLAWDNNGVLTEVANNGFVNCHIFATNEYFGSNGGRCVAFVGQAQYNNISAARDGAADEIHGIVGGSLLIQEMKAIATVIFQTSDSYSNAVKARVRSTGTGDYVDFRMEAGGTGTSPTAHGALSGLTNNDHSFYLDPRVEPMFLAYPNAVIANVTGDGSSYVIIYNSTSFDIDSNFNTSTGLFTAPVDGTYLFMANVTMDNISTVNHTTYYMSLNAQGGSFLCQSGGSAEAGSGTRISRCLNCIVYLTAGQTCGVVINMGGSSKTVDVALSAIPGTVRNSFAGYRIG